MSAAVVGSASHRRPERMARLSLIAGDCCVARQVGPTASWGSDRHHSFETTTAVAPILWRYCAGDDDHLDS
jgi:hypothetical protein